MSELSRDFLGCDRDSTENESDRDFTGIFPQFDRYNGRFSFLRVDRKKERSVQDFALFHGMFWISN